MRNFKAQTIILVLLSFILGNNEFLVMGILSNISQTYHVSIANVGLLVTAFGIIYAISTPIITSLIGNFNRYYSLIVLTIIFIFGNTLSGFASNYPILVISRVISASVAGAIISLSMTFSSVIAPKEKQGFVVSWIFSGFSIASVIGVPLSTAISSVFDWRVTFFLITGVSIITLILMMVSLPKDFKGQTSPLRSQFELLKDSRISFGILLPFFAMSAIYVTYTYLQPMYGTLGFPAKSLSVFLVIFGVTSLISNQLSGRISDHGGLKIMPKVYLFEIVVFLILPFFIQNKYLGIINLLMVGVIMYLINSPIQIHFLNTAKDSYPQAVTLASSLNPVFSNIGISLGSAVGSVIVGNWGLSPVGIGSSIFAIAALVINLKLNKIIAAKS
ncbi:MFS transporter [Companilactobacillus halodurans]|uniref:MFS transporter n=1 Tax=Companilactobacillus halodurans TaxID=2584183 RepID=A0A5P0ZPQ3_9LACO|nr:MFS transporter [Companilactobacillus halodurans]MQS76234.1 MFS transporter [Companilactobacillus halodurans]MQS97374.1 MFS transporter [Companilactobacillus halodurans]